MKNIVAISLLFSCLCIQAQEDTGVIGENKDKINQLNERLDKLMDESGVEDGDSLEIKINQLIRSVKDLEEEVRGIKISVDEINAGSKANAQSAESANEAAGENRGSNANGDIQEDKYYVVIAARRSWERAKQAARVYAHLGPVQIVRNTSNTWYYLILQEVFLMDDASMRADKYKEEGISDSWWVRGNKLRSI